VDGICARFINLREIGSFFELLAHHFNELLCIIRKVGVRQNVLRWVVADSVFVAAENVNGVSADSEPRSRNFSVIDGIAYSSVSLPRAFRPHVALGSESSHQIVAGRQYCHDGALGHRFLHGLQVFRSRMKKEMDMRVDQTRQQSAIA